MSNFDTYDIDKKIIYAVNNLLRKDYHNKVNELLDEYLKIINNIDYIKFSSISFLRNDKLAFYTVKTYPEIFEHISEKAIFQLFNTGYLSNSLNTKQMLFTTLKSDETSFKVFIFPLFIFNDPLGVLTIFFDNQIEFLKNDILKVIELCNFTVASTINGIKLKEMLSSNEYLINQQVANKTLDYTKTIKELKQIMRLLPVGLFILDAETKEILDTNYYTQYLSKMENDSIISSYRDFFIVDKKNDELVPIDFNFSSDFQNAFFKDCCDNLIPILYNSYYLKTLDKNYIVEVFLDNTPQHIQINDLKYLKNKQREIFLHRSQLLQSVSQQLLLYLNDIISSADILSNDINSDQKDIIDVIISSSSKLKVLIKHILDWSEINFTEIDIKNKNIDIKQFIENLLLQLKIFNSNVNTSIEYQAYHQTIFFFDEWLVNKLVYYIYSLILSIMKPVKVKITFFDSQLLENAYTLLFEVYFEKNIDSNTLQIIASLNEIYSIDSIFSKFSALDFQLLLYISSIKHLIKLLNYNIEIKTRNEKLEIVIEA